MSTSTTSPILSVTPGRTDLGRGADAAPCDIVVLSCTRVGDTLVVQLVGEIDHYSAGPLRVMLASAAAQGYTGLTLDTSRVTFCDSGLFLVLDFWPMRGRRLRLVNTSRAVRRVLEVAV
ncbi:hypothetical protein KY5_4070 [Streptomyces formicae]|uniref:STAS domain-containing protein n=1 Tax=Streptomyces formicae TaxID=1616117 RepID=A0A291QBZ2_9ACTN|nr:hypothetical protein KY5_4070 [Streptomyces formicae]